MGTKATIAPAPVPSPVTGGDVSLIRGGPFYRMQEATGLIGPDRWNFGRRVTFAIAVGWVPLLLITALFNRAALMPMLHDYRINVRMLVALPVLILGQMLMETRFRLIVEHIRKAHLLEGEELVKMDGIVAGLHRLRDSLLPEIAIIAVIAIRTVIVYRYQVAGTPWLSYEFGGRLHLTPAGWYAVLVSASIFQFLLYLNVWKWLLWTYFTFRLSKLNLQLIPTHPDENGGLGFLGMTPMAFAPIAFAATLVIGATFRHEILHNGAHLMSFKMPALALVAVIALVALGPLIFFVPRLSAVRRKGILEYAILGQIHSREFHQKWVLDPTRSEADLLAAPEVSTMCDYGQSYDRIEKLNPFPTDKGALIMLALSVVIAALPTVMAEIPLAVILKDLLQAMN